MVILNMSYIFNYNDFYNYYTNPSNVITDTSDCVSLYYFMDSDKIKKMNISNPKCTYIIVNGVKIYITIDIKKKAQPPYGLLFSIPTTINHTLFDFHYHFGKRPSEYTVITDKQYINDAVNKKAS